MKLLLRAKATASQIEHEHSRYPNASYGARDWHMLGSPRALLSEPRELIQPHLVKQRVLSPYIRERVYP